VAKEKNVPLMDLLHSHARAGRKAGLRALPRNRCSRQRREADTTHLGPIGRNEIGSIAAHEFVRAVPAMRPMLVSGLPAMQVVVASDGSGDFKTIQMAIDHAPFVPDGQRLNIEIRPGAYKNVWLFPQDRPRTSFLGEDARDDDYYRSDEREGSRGTFSSSTVDVQGAEFHATNITLRIRSAWDRRLSR